MLTAAALAHRVLADWALSGALLLFALTLLAAMAWLTAWPAWERRRRRLGEPSMPDQASLTPGGSRPVLPRPGRDMGGSPSARLEFQRLDGPGRHGLELWGVYERPSGRWQGSVRYVAVFRGYAFQPASETSFAAAELRAIAGEVSRLDLAYRRRQERRRGRLEQRGASSS